MGSLQVAFCINDIFLEEAISQKVCLVSKQWSQQYLIIDFYWNEYDIVCWKSKNL